MHSRLEGSRLRLAFAAPAAIGALILAAGAVQAQSPTPGASSTPGTGTGTSGTDAYTATLNGMNDQAGGNPAGKATVSMNGDEVTIDVNASGFSPSSRHMMHFHLGKSCPKPTDDTNGDGYVDAKEGEPSAGQILINLDDKLDDGDENSFPVADGSGNLTYSETVKLDDLTKAITGTDNDPNDGVTKLAAGSQINWDDLVLEIHGAGDNANLPGTVASLPGKDSKDTLPVACGELNEGNATTSPVSGASPSASATRATGTSTTGTAGTSGTTATTTPSATTTPASTSTPSATTTRSASTATATPSATSTTSGVSGANATGTATASGGTAVAGVSAPESGTGLAGSGTNMPWLLFGVLGIGASGLLFVASKRR